MKIISIRCGFASDHSSTSYEFLAIDKPLDKKKRTDISKLSSRADPGARRVNFTYNVDGYDIPGGWEKLMKHYYDVMYREEYSWWTLVIAFDADEKQYEKICAYEFDGSDNMGIRLTRENQRVIIEIHCVVEPGQYCSSEYDDYHEDDEGSNNVGDDGIVVATGDHILDTLAQVRQQISGGDYRALYAVWEVYGFVDEEDEDFSPPPKPKNRKAGTDIVKSFKEILTTI